MRKILSAVVVFSVLAGGFPAMANGAFGRDVNVIEVRPNRELLRIDRQRQAIKREIRRIREAEKAEIRERNKENRRLEREMEQDRKNYEKKVKAWKKSRSFTVY